MAINKHFYLVCFDIVDDKVRYRCVKTLLKFGKRVQKSVFECILNDKDYIHMKSILDKLIDKTVDSIRYYHLCALCSKNIEITGIGFFTENEDVIII